MKKYIIVGILALVFVIVLTHSFRYSKDENGLIIFNSNKSFIVFIPAQNLNFNVCSSDVTKLDHLAGFQLINTIEKSSEFFAPQCHIFTGLKGDEYPPEVANWYISKCNMKYSYKEALFDKMFSHRRYENFNIKMNNRPFINFKYIVRKDIDHIQLQKIE